MRRVIGEYTRGERGPLLVLSAGVHGNEPAGVEALEAVFAELARIEPPLRGRALALTGNTKALPLRRRFVDEDLNRLWTPERMQRRLAVAPERETSEMREQRELIGILERELTNGWESTTWIDLHSTSGLGPPFAILTNHHAHRRLADALGVPAVLGLHKNVPGTLIDWVEGQGHAAIVVEGGQNEAPETRERLVSVAWLALEACGLLHGGALDLQPHREVLRGATAHLPSEVEVALRWGIEPGDSFHMEPGFANLQGIRRGQLLARTGHFGEIPIHAPFDGLLLMPLYQPQGSDGFFLALPSHSWSRAEPRSA